MALTEEAQFELSGGGTAPETDMSANLADAKSRRAQPQCARGGKAAYELYFGVPTVAEANCGSNLSRKPFPRRM